MSPSDQDEDPYVLTSDLEIRSTLRSVQRHASLIRMYMRGNPDQSIMTAILALDDDAQRIIVDCSADPVLNARLVGAPSVVFDTQVDHISIHFTAKDLESCTYEDLPAISVPYPQALRRLQRRDSYRVDVPMGESASCMIPIAEPSKPPRRAVARIKDISAGGLALVDTDNQLPQQSGMTLRNVKLTLPETGEATVDLLVLRVHTEVLPNKKEIAELGCQFVDLPNATATLVQNYIGRLERRLNAKRRGF